MVSNGFVGSALNPIIFPSSSVMPPSQKTNDEAALRFLYFSGRSPWYLGKAFARNCWTASGSSVEAGGYWPWASVVRQFFEGNHELREFGFYRIRAAMPCQLNCRVEKLDHGKANKPKH